MSKPDFFYQMYVFALLIPFSCEKTSLNKVLPCKKGEKLRAWELRESSFNMTGGGGGMKILKLEA